MCISVQSALKKIRYVVLFYGVCVTAAKTHTNWFSRVILFKNVQDSHYSFFLFGNAFRVVVNTVAHIPLVTVCTHSDKLLAEQMTLQRLLRYGITSSQHKRHRRRVEKKYRVQSCWVSGKRKIFQGRVNHNHSALSWHYWHVSVG